MLALDELVLLLGLVIDLHSVVALCEYGLLGLFQGLENRWFQNNSLAPSWGETLTSVSRTLSQEKPSLPCGLALVLLLL